MFWGLSICFLVLILLLGLSRTEIDPPGQPSIAGYTTGQVVHAGSMMRLACVSIGGNPTAQLLWYRNDEEADFSYNSVVNIIRNEMTFEVQPQDNNAVYKCEASNRAVPTPLISQVILVVHFPPTKVMVSGKKLAKAGERVTLTCESSISNPPAVITWFAKGRQLPNTYTVVEASLDGGFISMSEIEVQVELTDQEKNIIYTCQATNPALGRTVADNITLDVLFAAEIIAITSTVKEDLDGSAVFFCNAVANPVTDNMVSWSREGFDMSKTKQNYKDGEAFLIVYELEKTDAGDFTCLADNGLGRPATKTTTLIVMFAPEIDKSPELTKAASKKGSAARLICKADGAPFVSFKWIRDRMDVVPDETKYTIEQKMKKLLYENVLIINNVTKDDYGVYVCVATNSKGEDTFEITLHGTNFMSFPRN